MRLACPILLLLAAAPALAGEAGLPRYDDDLYCARVGVIGLTTSITTYEGCAKLEKAARKQLESTWPEASPMQRRHCELTATFAGAGSYAVLAGCLERLRAAAGGEGEPVGN